MSRRHTSRIAAILTLGAGCAGAAGAEWNVNGCRLEDAVRWFDVAPATRVIAFPTAFYNPPCVAIEEGQSVRWAGNFGSHPLRPGFRKDGGPQPGNPIPSVSSGSTPVDVSFAESNGWAYFCQAHEPPMAGAVYVAFFADGFESEDTADWSSTVL